MSCGASRTQRASQSRRLNRATDASPALAKGAVAPLDAVDRLVRGGLCAFRMAVATGMGLHMLSRPPSPPAPGPDGVTHDTPPASFCLRVSGALPER
eukprot:363466-Chlamydomonas_euryale.AAC.12